jgi:16S rRNA (uracil1498-N3)-methyltransferase
MEHCVVKLEEKKKAAKVNRWQAIAESAAKQSKRTSIPVISDVLSYKEALKKAESLDVLLVPYENERGMLATKEALAKIQKGMTIGIIIGPEGGFSDKEIALAKEQNGEIISLGKRILRTETAAITALGMCMLYSEMEL